MPYVSKQQSINEMFASIARRYDLLNDVLSFGIHRWWRWQLLKRVRNYEVPVAVDLCTGSGALLRPLRRYASIAIGVDICRPMLERVGAAYDMSRSAVIQGDAHSLPFADATVDLATVAYGVRNFVELERGLNEVRRVLRKGGLFLVLELGQPKAPWLRGAYRFYARVMLPRLGALLAGNRGAYEYLQATAATFPSGHAFAAILSRCGFDVLECRPMTLGIAYLYVARRAGTSSGNHD